MPEATRLLPPERDSRRCVVTAMPSFFTLPILGGSLLVAAAVGVQLGESSVGLINPIYFEEPPLHPRDRGAAIEERALQPARTGYAGLYGWEQGHAAIAAECFECGAPGAHDEQAYSARVPYFGSRGEVRVAVADARELLGDRFAEVPDDVAPRRADVERYAHYPVTEDAPPTRFEFKEPPQDDGASGIQE